MTFAPKCAFQTLATSFTVEGGAPILVYGYTVSSNANFAIAVRDIDGNIVNIIQVRSGKTYIMNIPFLANNGLVFDVSDADKKVTVCYGLSG